MKNLINSFFIISLILVLSSSSLYAQDFWEQTNGPFGGDVSSLVTNANGEIFAATEAGIFRSDDASESWIVMNTEFAFHGPMAINADGDIFARIGDGYEFGRSSDNGVSWTEVTTSDFRWVESIAINASGDIFAGTENGLFRSFDNGNNWTKIGNESGLTTSTVFTIAINPDGYIFAGTLTGVFRSSNNGDSWTRLLTGLPNEVLFFHISAGGDIFAGTDGGVFRSIDNGDSWTPINTGLMNIGTVGPFAENANGHIFAGTSKGIYRSTNNGDSWTVVANPGLVNIGPLVINANGDIFAGTVNGILRVTNNGSFFGYKNTGLANVAVGPLAINASGDIFAGTVTGLFRTIDNGENWTEINADLIDDGVGQLTINASGDIFANDGTELLRSSDNGENWDRVWKGEDDEITRSFILNDVGDLFVSTYDEVANISRVWRYTDNDEWTEISNDLMNFSVESFAINADGDIFAGTDGGVFRSIDNGDSWTAIFDDYVGEYWGIGALAIHPNGDIYLTSTGRGYSGIHRSTNNGDSWSLIDTGLDNYRGGSLSIVTNGDIFIGTNDGVARSIDNGNSWAWINAGLTYSAGSIVMNADGYIFAGTDGGVFRSTETTTSVDEIVNVLPNEYSLSQNFPNPFNPVTNIRYSLPVQSDVMLVIYNVVGEEIRRINEPNMQAGEYNISWNASNAPSGIYFYRLQAGDFVLTRKMVLLK